ncbi:MAG TPA: hypothetical protein PLO59_08315, partial [Bacteroidia bacterium]|nr:hypothetical protein [Bacteroidia bacterium]
TVMGILPIGSGNGLARHLCLPFNWQSNINLLLHGKIVCIDTLRVNKKLSVNISGLGFEGQVAADFSKRKSRGLWGYLVTIIKTAFSYQSFEATIQYDGYTHKQTAISIAIANASQYGNNAVIAPEASLSDETGNLVLIQKPSLLQIILAIPAFFQGKIQSKSYIQNIRFRKATIISTSVAIHIDGEPYGHTQSVEVEVVPASLRLLIPAALFKY